MPHHRAAGDTRGICGSSAPSHDRRRPVDGGWIHWRRHRNVVEKGTSGASVGARKVVTAPTECRSIRHRRRHRRKHSTRHSTRHSTYHSTCCGNASDARVGAGPSAGLSTGPSTGTGTGVPPSALFRVRRTRRARSPQGRAGVTLGTGAHRPFYSPCVAHFGTTLRAVAAVSD